MKKSILSLLLTLIMLLSLMPASAAEVYSNAGSGETDHVYLDASTTFKDVPEKSSLYTAVMFLTGRNILTGYPDGTFGPEKSITRAEFMAVLCRFTGAEARANSLKKSKRFTDLSTKHWANGYINAGQEQGMVNGYPDGTFKPEDNIKVEEAVKTIMCIVKDSREFSASSPWYKTYLDYAKRNNYMKDTTSKVETDITRGDVVRILTNISEIPEKEYSVYKWKTPKPMSMYKDYSQGGDERYSLCLTSDFANDERLIGSVPAQGGESYVVSAEVKTQNLVNEESKTNGYGAQIAAESFNTSASLQGNNDWTTIRKWINPNADGNIEYSLCLGYNGGTCTGKVWYRNIKFQKASDFVQGLSEEDKVWHFLYVIPSYEIMEVTDENGKVTRTEHKRSEEVIQYAKDDIAHFTDDLSRLTNGMMKADLKTIVLDAPLIGTKESRGYFYVPPKDAKAYLDAQGISLEGYDHVIFSHNGLGDTYGGLGGSMIYGDVGYSQIHSRADKHYNHPTAFKSAIFVHEFLHSMDTYSEKLGLDHLNLHDGEKYGYINELDWEPWYTDYMNKEVVIDGVKQGLDAILWSLPPTVFDIEK